MKTVNGTQELIGSPLTYAFSLKIVSVEFKG